MKFTADKKEMAKALDLALLASGRTSKDAALANVLLRVNGSQQSATVESYDTHLFSSAKFNVVGETGEFAIEGSRLDHLIKTADDGSIEFNVGPDGAAVTFGKHASINLRTFPVEKYVRFTTSGTVNDLTQGIRSSLLLTALEFVRPFIGKDAGKPTQTILESRRGKFMAGDGTRIGAVSFGNDLEGYQFPLKIHQSMVSNVVRWLKDGTAFMEEGKPVEGLIDIKSDQDFYILQTATGDNMLAWRKPEPDFAAVERFLDELERDVPEALIFKVDQVSLQKLVDSLSVVLEAGAERITFNTNGDSMPQLVGTTRDSRGIASNNQVPIVYPSDREGEHVDRTFSIRYSHLLDTLRLMSNPVITLNVRTDKAILRIAEQHPEMTKVALLTLMSEEVAA